MALFCQNKLKMKTIELSGVIKFEWNDFEKIKLIQEDGYKIDLVGRFKEAIESFPNAKVQVNYYLSEKVCTKKEMVEGFLNSNRPFVDWKLVRDKLYGAIAADYEKNDYRYSSWTSGGHNMIDELRNEAGKFIIIDINFQSAISK